MIDNNYGSSLAYRVTIFALIATLLLGQISIMHRIESIHQDLIELHSKVNVCFIKGGM